MREKEGVVALVVMRWGPRGCLGAGASGMEKRVAESPSCPGIGCARNTSQLIF